MTACLPDPFEISVTTRDGVVVRADVYLPESTMPVPVLLAASPYQKALMSLPSVWTFPFRETGPLSLYLESGFGFVWMDVPGSGRSEGTWDPVSRTEGEAIHDVVEWVASQEWCNGKVGMYGQSYYCWSAWNVARTRPPHLTTIVAFDGATDMYRDWMYHGGIPVLTFIASWTTTTMLQHQAQGHDIRGGDRHLLLSEIYGHPFDDEWHHRRSPYWELDGVDIPVLSIGCWGKAPLHLRGNVRGFERVRGPKQLLITEAGSFPAAQALFADEDFHLREILPWYEHHLLGADNGVMERPPVRFFVEGAGTYDASDEWPPTDVVAAEFFLSPEPSRTVDGLYDGSLAAAAPPAGAEAVTWSYPDPRWIAGTSSIGDDGRPDHHARMVSYTSPPFDDTVRFAGDGHVVLHCSTDQQDMDMYVKLYVLGADGDLRRVGLGWLRLSHRSEDAERATAMRPFHRHEAPDPVRPGEIYEVRIELLPLAFEVGPGERLRLEVSNADSSITEGLFHHWFGLKCGADTYHHGADHPSRVVLPRRPRADAAA